MASIQLTIDGRDFAAQSASGREAVGEHFRIEVQAVGKNDKPADFVGKTCTFTLQTRDDDKLAIHGIVRRAGGSYGRGGQLLSFEIGPAVEILTLGQDTRVFLDQSTGDIVADVLSRGGFASGSDFTAPPAGGTRAYTTQYREDDWSFVDRLLREEGVVWFYEHGADATKLVFLEDSTKAESLGDWPHRLVHGGAAAHLKWVSALSARTVTATTKYTTNDRDALKPALDLTASTGDGDLEVYAWPARNLTEAGVKKRAKVALETLRADRVRIHGEAASFELRCGKLVTVTESTTLPEAYADLFVVAVDWTMGGDGAFSATFDAIPKATPFHLPALPAARVPLGPETAFVRRAEGEEITVNDAGAAFAQPVWDRLGPKTQAATIPQRVGQIALDRSLALPRIGWTTLIGHHDDDMDRPWIMARLVDGTHPVPYKLPDNMTRTSWQTLTSGADGEHPFSEIVFEDKGGSEQLVVHAAKDMTVEIGDNEARTVGNRHVLEVTGDRKVTVDADDKLTVTKDQTTTVKGTETSTIDGNRSLTIKGKEEVTVSGARNEKAKADRTLDVGGNRKVTVSATMKTTAKKAFTREIVGKHAVSTAATWLTQVDGGLTLTAKGDGEETVAAARTSNGKEGVETIVKGDFTDSVAAAHTVTSKGSAGESAKGKMKLTVGAALTAIAPEIEISAESEITIACGGATITIKSSEVAVKAPLLAITGPMVVLDGAQVKHNP